MSDFCSYYKAVATTWKTEKASPYKNCIDADFKVITLDNKFQKLFVSVMNMLLIYLFASMKLEKGHKKLLDSSFKIMLPLQYITK